MKRSKPDILAAHWITRLSEMKCRRPKKKPEAPKENKALSMVKEAFRRKRFASNSTEDPIQEKEKPQEELSPLDQHLLEVEKSKSLLEGMKWDKSFDDDYMFEDEDTSELMSEK